MNRIIFLEKKSNNKSDFISNDTHLGSFIKWKDRYFLFSKDIPAFEKWKSLEHLTWIRHKTLQISFSYIKLFRQRFIFSIYYRIIKPHKRQNCVPHSRLSCIDLNMYFIVLKVKINIFTVIVFFFRLFKLCTMYLMLIKLFFYFLLFIALLEVLSILINFCSIIQNISYFVLHFYDFLSYGPVTGSSGLNTPKTRGLKRF